MNRHTITCVIVCMSNIFVTIPEIELREIVKESKSISNIFDKMGLCKTGPQYKKLKARLDELNIDTSHFIKRYFKGRMESRPIEFYLKKIPIYPQALSKTGLLKKIC